MFNISQIQIIVNLCLSLTSWHYRRKQKQKQKQKQNKTRDGKVILTGTTGVLPSQTPLSPKDSCETEIKKFNFHFSKKKKKKKSIFKICVKQM